MTATDAPPRPGLRDAVTGPRRTWSLPNADPRAPPRLRGLGVFAPFVAGGEELPAYQHWLGRRVHAVVDNADETQDWNAMVRSATFLARRYEGCPHHLVLGVPMLPRQGGASLSRGAAGEYDAPFRIVAQELVGRGLRGCTVRLGWEFNGRWMPWFAGNDPDGFVRCWRRVVDVFRRESLDFRFDWCATLGSKGLPTDRAWPGPEHVDVIGADVYNEWWNPRSRADPDTRWHNEFLWSEFGLQWQITFAREHDKQVSFPEWGTRPLNANGGHGGGDDPGFVERMAGWFDGAGDRLAYHAYFERLDVALSHGAYPRSATRFRQLFGKR